MHDPGEPRVTRSVSVVSAQAADLVWRAGRRRGVPAVRNGAGPSVRQAEACIRVFPVVGQELL